MDWWFNPKSCLTLVTPWTVACQAPWSMGFSRQEYWSELPFPSPGDLPNPGIEPQSPALQAVYRLSFKESSPEGQASNLMCTSRSLPEPSLGIKTAGLLSQSPSAWLQPAGIIYNFFFFNSRAFIFLLFFLFPVDMISTLSLCLSTASRPCCAPLLPHSKALSSKRQDLHTFGA